LSYVSFTAEVKKAHKVLISKPEGKETTWKSRCRWEDNIEIDLQEINI
jgi:hypothetical protein